LLTSDFVSENDVEHGLNFLRQLACHPHQAILRASAQAEKSVRTFSAHQGKQAGQLCAAHVGVIQGIATLDEVVAEWRFDPTDVLRRKDFF